MCRKYCDCGQNNLPSSPLGYHWEKITIGPFNISAYIFADERDSDYAFTPMTDVRGLSGQAKWDFLFKRGGIATQGTGLRTNGELIHLANPDALNWEDKFGNVVSYENGVQIKNWKVAWFKRGPGVNLTPYYSIAAPRTSKYPFPPNAGIKLYIPAIIPALNRLGYIPSGSSKHNGIFEIQDRCPGCYQKSRPDGTLGPYSLDLFVGTGIAQYNNWIKQSERLNVTVYQLVPGKEGLNVK